MEHGVSNKIPSPHPSKTFSPGPTHLKIVIFEKTFENTQIPFGEVVSCGGNGPEYKDFSHLFGENLKPHSVHPNVKFTKIYQNLQKSKIYIPKF